jgi:tRNA A-37 threonylcarbamoyl transferase component Bud32
MEGGTTLIINVEYYDPNLDYQCVLPQAVINAVKLGDGRISCLTPTPCASREAVFSMSFRIVQTQATIGALFFLPYIQPSVKTITPARAKPGENITVTGSGFESHPDLTWYCRVGGVPSPIAVFDAAKSALICQVPTSGLTLNAAAAVDVSLNGQNWSNSSVVFIAVETPVKHWYDMPTILYIVLGIVGGLILAAILIFVAVRACRRSKLSSNKLSGADEAVEPLLRGSYGPRTPASTSFDSTSLPAEFEKLDVKQIKLGQRIGKGSFGEVYLGTYLGTEVAVKKLPANKLSTQFMQEFAREAALMRGLRHPNVVQFLGATMDEPDICIVTEYMAKGSLYHLLHDPKVAISWEMVRKIALDAAKGMAYLHMRSPAIIHRDLKSHNLLVDENWKVKVCDFGLSKIAVDQQNTMTACGTPCWTAPEILRNARYTTKADVFSYGIVLWELVTRDEPFAGMPAFQVIFAVGNKSARLPLPQVCPPELIKLIVSCWQEDPSLRPPFSDIIIYLERLSFATND